MNRNLKTNPINYSIFSDGNSTILSQSITKNVDAIYDTTIHLQGSVIATKDKRDKKLLIASVIIDF
jgi:hypothetical protein